MLQNVQSQFYFMLFNVVNFSESVVKETNSTLQQWTEITWRPKDFIMHPHYITFYNNVARNLITAVIPLVSLGFLNYLVYKHLTERRKMVSRLGMFCPLNKIYVLVIYQIKISIS